MNNDILNGFFDADTFVQTNSYILSPSADPESPAGDGVTTATVPSPEERFLLHSRMNPY